MIIATPDSQDEFVVIEVPPDAPRGPEAMGSKPKFWFQHEELGRCLFKQSRPGGGEDWAEKVASELCKLLGLPYAAYDLAHWNGGRGTVSPSFVPESGTLIHGNEILVEMDPDYPQPESASRSYCRVPLHTVNLVLSALEKADEYGPHLPFNWDPPAGISKPGEVFVGYLMLDAWIGNQDRHHGNWSLLAIFQRGDPPVSLHLAPTYDHASSFGCNESDETRQKRLSTKDTGYSISTYVGKAKSGFFARKEDQQPLTTLDAFREAAACFGNAARIWLNCLADLSNDDTLQILRCVPSDRISHVAIEFTQELLGTNRSRLLDLREDLP